MTSPADSSSEQKVKFSTSDQRFDKDTYWGRVQAISAGTQIKNAFKTKD